MSDCNLSPLSRAIWQLAEWGRQRRQREQERPRAGEAAEGEQFADRTPSAAKTRQGPTQCDQERDTISIPRCVSLGPKKEGE